MSIQFGDYEISGLRSWIGLIPVKQNLEIVSVLSQWTNQLQQDWQKEADVFVRAIYKKPVPEDYVQKVNDSTLEVPTDTAVALPPRGRKQYVVTCLGNASAVV